MNIGCKNARAFLFVYLQELWVKVISNSNVDSESKWKWCFFQVFCFWSLQTGLIIALLPLIPAVLGLSSHWMKISYSLHLWSKCVHHLKSINLTILQKLLKRKVYHHRRSLHWKLSKSKTQAIEWSTSSDCNNFCLNKRLVFHIVMSTKTESLSLIIYI